MASQARRSSLWWPHRRCLAPRHLVVALARRLEIPASDHVFEAVLSFVDVDQVGDDSYERLSAHCEAVLKFVRILLEAFPIAPVDTTVAPAVVQCRATGPWWPLSNVFRSPPEKARKSPSGGKEGGWYGVVPDSVAPPGPRDCVFERGARLLTPTEVRMVTPTAQRSGALAATIKECQRSIPSQRSQP
jgi:hypothetical protein